MTDEKRGPDGLWRKGHSGNPGTMFKPGDPDNPRTRQKRERAARGKEPSAAAQLRREEMRAELVALDVLERILSGARDMAPRRLPRLPGDAKGARREAARLAARGKARVLRAMQRIARDPNEAPDVRMEIARLMLDGGRWSAAPADHADTGGKGAKKEPKVIVVQTNVPRSPWRMQQEQGNTPGRAGDAPATKPVAPPPAPPKPPAPEPVLHRAGMWADIAAREAEERRGRYGSPEDDE